MLKKPDRGLFISGTDTGVGKTYVSALIAKSLVSAGYRVGVYKPAASGCRRDGDTLQCDDAIALWNAAGQPGSIENVCPQVFEAPVAPHLAAAAVGRQVDPQLLRTGIEYWHDKCDIVLVEGAGGLMSPISDEDYVADLAFDFGFPLVVVAANVLGVINQTLQTLIAAATFRDGIEVAGIVINNRGVSSRQSDDPSVNTNRQQLERHCVPPVLAQVDWQANQFDCPVAWWELASQTTD